MSPNDRACVILIALCVAPVASRADYDPMQTSGSTISEPIDLTIKDADRDREIPILCYLPKSEKPAPVILFSHGLGGSRNNNAYLGKHWSARGYVVVCMQHIGSDESVWKNTRPRERLSVLKQAASFQQTLARFADVKAVIDALEKWNQTDQHPLRGRLDLEHIGMSGHSYGAATTQAVSGQSARLIGQRFTDRRIDAAMMFSPNRPRKGEPKEAFASVSIPWMLMTGTKDTSPINDTTPEDRQQVYPFLPKTIDKYELVLHEGEHHAFGDGGSPIRKKRNPNHHPLILALSTAFWDTHLRDHADAKVWLHGDAPRKLMEPKDKWQLNVAAQQRPAPSRTANGN